MKRILITGFEPFNNSPVNPTQELMRQLSDTAIDGVELRTRVLPSVFRLAGRAVAAEIDAWRPDAVICFGQGGGASIAVERIGVNLEDAGIPDNAGDQPTDRPIVVDGPTAYLATLPTKAICVALNQAGIPARLSMSAGLFVCNHTLYSVLRHLALRNLTIPAGFIHVPKLLSQVAADHAREKDPSLSLETLTAAARVIIGVTAAHAAGAAPRERALVGADD